MNTANNWAIRFFTLWTGQALSLLGSQLVQFAIKPDMQGRVFAFILSAAMLVSPIALIIAGPFADAFGIQLWFLVAGIGCTMMGAAGFFSPDVMRMESRPAQESQHALTEPS